MNVSLSKFCKDYGLPKTSVYRRCSELGFDISNGLTAEMVVQLEHEFDVQAPQQTVPPSFVESGNHSIVLSAPSLPQSYSLEVLRDSESVSFDDPLSIAQKFLQDADQLKVAMALDVEARQRRLEETKAAQDAIARKAQELTLEARLYRLQTETLDSALSKETQTLSESLQALQRLGKPSAPDAQSLQP